HVIDVTDPANPQEVGSYQNRFFGITRGVAVSGRYACLAAVDAGLLVIDVSDPASPQLAANHDRGGFPYGVAVSRGYAYVAVADAGLQVIDLNRPANPQQAGSNNSLTNARA